MSCDGSSFRTAYTPLKSLTWSCILILAFGGCTWSPFGAEKDTAGRDKADAAPELEHCTLKAGACRNSCYKAGAGAKCTACCSRNAELCDLDKSYSFYSCPDEE